jgi:hypothetical protein
MQQKPPEIFIRALDIYSSGQSNISPTIVYVFSWANQPPELMQKPSSKEQKNMVFLDCDDSVVV